MANAYALTKHDGKTVDEITHQALLEAERRLGYELTIVQGSYHRGVSASAGTHDGGGVVDLAPWHHAEKVKVLREVGFAAWFRPALPGVWGDHIHAVLIGNKKLAPSAARQVEAYYMGRNGLADNGPDNAPRPSPIPVFQWPPVYTRGAEVDSSIRHAQRAAKQARRHRAKRRLRVLHEVLKKMRALPRRRKF